MMRRLLIAPLLLAAAPAAAQTAEQKLDALEARIERLEDLNQIERVQRTYGYFVDKGQWTQLSELFTDDATLEIGGKGLFLGKDRVLEYMQTAFGPDGAKPGANQDAAGEMAFHEGESAPVAGRHRGAGHRGYLLKRASCPRGASRLGTDRGSMRGILEL